MKISPLVFVAGLIVCGCGSPPAQDTTAEPVVTVESVPAVRRDMRKLLEVQGSLVSSQGGSAKLTPQVAGRIAQVYVKEGDNVSQGQLLARVDVQVQSAQQQSA